MFSNKEILYVIAENLPEDRFEGAFAKQTLVLYPAGESEGEYRDFLTKVFQAVQIELDKDTLHGGVPAGETLGLTTFLKEKHPRYGLIFGVSPQQLGFQIQAEYYRPFEFYQTRWLFAEAPSVLIPDKNKKSALWAALKGFFS